MSIVVIGATFVDIKGYPFDNYLATGRNVGDVKYIHGGVARNVVEDIANIELRPTFVGIVDNTPLGKDVYEKLKRHKINVDYVIEKENGMGTWLAIFDSNGDVAGSISKRPDMSPLLDILEKRGDEIFLRAKTVVIEIDLDKAIVKKTIELAKKHKVKIIGLVSNMRLVVENRPLVKDVDCLICNIQEAGIYFSDNYDGLSPKEMLDILALKVIFAKMKLMIVTMGEKGAIYATHDGETGYCKAKDVHVIDTTGAGDAFCAGVAIGLTYGKSNQEAIEIGSYLAASVVNSKENVCPRFEPQELGIFLNDFVEF